MTQVNLAKDFLLKDGKEIDELAYRIAVRKFASKAKKPFNPRYPNGESPQDLPRFATVQ